MKRKPLQNRQLFHVKYFYGGPDNACEIITVGAYSEHEAILNAADIARKKGYEVGVKYYPCTWSGKTKEFPIGFEI